METFELTQNLKHLVSKLPFNLQDRWRNRVFDAKERGDRVKFRDLVSFVKREAKKANDPAFGRVAMANDQPLKSQPKMIKKPSFVTSTKDTSIKSENRSANKVEQNT